MSSFGAAGEKGQCSEKASERTPYQSPDATGFKNLWRSHRIPATAQAPQPMHRPESTISRGLTRSGKCRLKISFGTPAVILEALEHFRRGEQVRKLCVR